MEVCFPLSMRINTLGSECAHRGLLDLESRRMNTSDTFKSDHATTFRNQFGKDVITTLLHFNSTSLSSSFPTQLLPHARVVESIRIHTDRTSGIQGFSYLFREAIGAPLFTTALVEISPVVVAAGPYITDKDRKLSLVDRPDEPEPAESQSFLRRYWWVIAGFFLLSSFFGSSEQSQQGSSDQQGSAPPS